MNDSSGPRIRTVTRRIQRFKVPDTISSSQKNGRVLKDHLTSDSRWMWNSAAGIVGIELI